MKLLERVLLATDFSTGADDALQVALSVVKTFHSELVLLHVLPGVPGRPLVTDMVKKTLSEQLQDIAHNAQAEGVGTVAIVTASGVPCDEIGRLADQRDVNVIIVGSGETVSADQYRLGATAAAVSRNAARPVWVVKRGAPPRINKILCAVDLLGPSRCALRNAVHLSRSFQAELTVMTVIQPLSGRCWGLGRVSTSSQEAHVKAQEAQLDRLLRDFDLCDVGWHKVLREGKPHEEILAVAIETEADLLVIGSGGRTGLTRMLAGSIAERVAGKVPCSMITVKSEPAIRLRLDAGVADGRARCIQGQELLKKGFPAEAICQFEQCIAQDSKYTPAWEGLAAAYKRLGQEKNSERCLATAREVGQTRGERQVNADLQSKLFRLLKRS